MPPTTAHLNGSVNLPGAETVMREVLRRIPRGLRRVPDGETGDRGRWILFQFLKFRQTEGLELRRPDADAATYHPAEQPAGTTEEQARLIDERLGGREWGICTECGMGRVGRDDVLPMLDRHREILARFGPATG
ncbi:MAG: hypothetical protein ACXVHB_18565 [Solirubrobacteraceae bacterium]